MTESLVADPSSMAESSLDVSACLVETDVLAAFLTARGGQLREALARAVCYTTVMSAIELLRAASGDAERAAVMRVLGIVRVLGIPAKGARQSAEFASATLRESLVLGLALASHMAVLTES